MGFGQTMNLMSEKKYAVKKLKMKGIEQAMDLL